MTKKLIVGVLVLVACLWVVKKTQVLSYASTIITNGKAALQHQIPREFEIARVKNEIQRLDRDYAALLGPIAEKKAAVRRLENEVSNTETRLTDRRDALLALTNAIDSKQKEIVYNDSNYSLAQAKVRLAQDFATFKKMEVKLATQKKLLEAQRQNLEATIAQLGKLVVQKREFETALAEIEANEAVLAATRVSTPLRTDDGRVSDIANTLKDLKEAQEVERERRTLEQQYGTRIGDAQPTPTQVTDLTAVREHLEGRGTPVGTTKVAQGSK